MKSPSAPPLGTFTFFDFLRVSVCELHYSHRITFSSELEAAQQKNKEKEEEKEKVKEKKKKEKDSAASSARSPPYHRPTAQSIAAAVAQQIANRSNVLPLFDLCISAFAKEYYDMDAEAAKELVQPMALHWDCDFVLSVSVSVYLCKHSSLTASPTERGDAHHDADGAARRSGRHARHRIRDGPARPARCGPAAR